MSRHRVAAIFRRVIAEIRRDRPSLGLLFIAPLIITGLLTFILREAQTPSIDAAIVNEAGAPGQVIANLLGNALQRQGGHVTDLADEATARAGLKDGTLSVALILPADLASGGGSTITVLTNGLDPAGEAGQLTALQKGLLAAASGPSGTRLPSVRHDTLYGTPSNDQLTNFAPALGPLPAFSVGLNVVVAGSPIVAFAVVLLLAIGAVSLGIFLSAIARTELQIIQFIQIVIVPQFLLSGVLFPLSSLPAVVQPIAPFLPLTWAVNGLRQVFVAGAGFATPELQLDLLVLAAFAAFFATIAALTIRRDVV